MRGRTNISGGASGELCGIEPKFVDYVNVTATQNTWYTVLDVTGEGIASRLSIGGLDATLLEIRITKDNEVSTFSAGSSDALEASGLGGFNTNAGGFTDNFANSKQDFINNLIFKQNFKLEIRSLNVADSALYALVCYSLNLSEKDTSVCQLKKSDFFISTAVTDTYYTVLDLTSNGILESVFYTFRTATIFGNQNFKLRITIDGDVYLVEFSNNNPLGGISNRLGDSHSASSIKSLDYFSKIKFSNSLKVEVYHNTGGNGSNMSARVIYQEG